MGWWPFGANEPGRLSICVITLDRKKELRGLLANLSDVGDEIVVVDGGSTDGSLELLEAEERVRLVERPWDGSWSRAKNAAYDAARGDWILNVDTDERIGDRLKERLPKLTASSWYDFYRLPMYWVARTEPLQYVDTAKHYPCHVPRLFRNLPEHRWVEEERLHPTFPKSVVRKMKKIHGAHLFHLVYLFNDRETLEARMAAYEEQDPSSRETNEKYYPYWRISHELKPCVERWTPMERFEETR